MSRRGRLIAGVCACAAALAAGAAHATAGVECEALDGSGATVEMNFGRGIPASAPNWVRVSVGDKGRSTLAIDEATPVVVLQSFDDGRLFAIDLADDGVSELVIAIRVLRVEEGEEPHEIGYLHLVGRSVHPISCINSE